MDCALSQTSMSRYIKEIVTALNHPDILTRFIRFPVTREERHLFIHRNERLGMPRVLGFIDGFLLRMTNMKHTNERQGYFTRKNWTGLNVQIICDADLYIMNVDASWPGSCNDQYIWSNSAARQVVEQAYWADRCWLLGDSGYCSAPWLHTPLPHAVEGTPEFDYTQLHCHCRNRVERCIGMLKGRWRILCTDRCIHYGDPIYAGLMVNACSVLHNYCRLRGVPDPPPIIEALEDEPPYYNDLDMDQRLLARQEMNFLINHAHRRRVKRNIVVNAV